MDENKTLSGSDKSVMVNITDDEVEAAKMSADRAVEQLTSLAINQSDKFARYDFFKGAVAQLLRHIDPKRPYGTTLFDALTRLTWTIAFEAVAMRRNKWTDKIEVYLRKRAMDDTAYPGEYHAPGSAFRPGETQRNVADRLEKEFGTRIISWSHVCDFMNQAEARGSFESKVYLVRLEGEPRIDDRHCWAPVNILPSPMVGFHEKHIIPQALFAYEESETTRWAGGTVYEP